MAGQGIHGHQVAIWPSLRTHAVYTYVDALEWILRQEGSQHLIHYLDDFLLLGPPHSPACKQGLAARHALHLPRLVVPLAADKIEGPTTCLTFLGIELDSSSMEAQLPQDKLRRLSTELATWQGRKACKRHELEHLLGLLHFACTVVVHGRPFMRSLTNLVKIPSKPFHHLRLNQEARSDLAWWGHFVEHWNGVSLLNCPRHLRHLPMFSLMPPVVLAVGPSGATSGYKGYGHQSESA
jgi:hypothetical protein